MKDYILTLWLLLFSNVFGFPLFGFGVLVWFHLPRTLHSGCVAFHWAPISWWADVIRSNSGWSTGTTGGIWSHLICRGSCRPLGCRPPATRPSPPPWAEANQGLAAWQHWWGLYCGLSQPPPTSTSLTQCTHRHNGRLHTVTDLVLSLNTNCTLSPAQQREYLKSDIRMLKIIFSRLHLRSVKT